MARFIVELEAGVWYAEWEGGPGRTLKKRSARRFDSKKDARTAIVEARKYRPFEGAKVVDAGLSDVIQPSELKHCRDEAHGDWVHK